MCGKTLSIMCFRILYKSKSHHNFPTTNFKAVKLCYFCRLCCPLSCSSVLPWATSTLVNSKMSMDEFDSLQPCMQSPIYTSTSPGLDSSLSAVPMRCPCAQSISCGTVRSIPTHILLSIITTITQTHNYVKYIFLTLYFFWYWHLFFIVNI